jgi:hypothetical protein
MSRRVVHALIVSVVLAGLAGCVSPEELRRQDEAACTGYGFTRGTSEFATCLQRENLARRYGPPPDFGWYGGPGWYPPPPYVIR